MGQYVEKHRNAINDSKTDKEIDTVLNGIYEDGFEDGCDCTE